MAQTGMTYEDSRKARVVAGMALTKLSPKTAVALGLSESGKSLQQRLSGHAQNAFLVARDPMTRTGFYADAGTSLGLRHDLGPVAITVTSERGNVYTSGLRRTLGRPTYSIGSVTADRKIGPAIVSLSASRLAEDSTVLGGSFSAAFAGAGSTSYFVDGSADFDFGGGWGAYVSYRRGWTAMPGTGALVDQGKLSTDAWAFDLSKRNAFLGGDKLALRMMQPLRVRSGGFALAVPVSYDYANGDVGYEARQFSLAPTGREIDYEMSYSVPAFGGQLGANLFLRTDPGHVTAMRDDKGAAIRYTLGF